MLQIVPSAGFSPPASSEYSADYSVDSFDLSLLPGGVENDTSFSASCNGNSNVQQFFSLYYDVNSPPPALFAPYDNTVSTTKDNTYLSGKDLLTSSKQQPRYDDVMSMFKKTEPSIEKCPSWRDDFGSIKDTISVKSPSDEHVLSKNTFLDMEMVDWEGKSEWDTIRVQSSIPSVTSSSNCSSPDFQLCPSTPPDFDSILPLEDIKQEITLNLQNLLTEDKPCPIDDKYKEKKPELLRSILEKTPLNDSTNKKMQLDKQIKCSSKDDNHKLLREVLKDTSFQKKYNLKPFDIEGLGTCYQTEIKTEDGKILNKEDVCDVNLAEGIIAPMLSKAIEQLMQDVDNTCIMLGIPRGKFYHQVHYLLYQYIHRTAPCNKVFLSLPDAIIHRSPS